MDRSFTTGTRMTPSAEPRACSNLSAGRWSCAGGAMLAEIYNRFTEGFYTADLKDAKALLDELNN